MRMSLVEETTEAMSSRYTMPGRAYGPPMQIAHLLKCLKRTGYDDNPGIRLRQHVLLFGPKGFSKSSSSRYFLTTLAGCVDPLTRDGRAALAKGDHPRFAAWKNGAGMERLRGTTDAIGIPVDPLLQKIDWLYSPELMSTLGHAPQTRGDRMDMLNGWLEEGDVLVFLTKMTNMPIEERREVARQLRAQNKPYYYDAEDCSISYDAHFSFLGCTRFLDAKLMAELLASGYWERHVISELAPSRSQMEAYANNKFGPSLPAERIDAIRQRNLDLWRTKFVEVNMPPAALVTKTITHYNGMLRVVCESLGADFTKEVNGRDDLDVIHLITAAAVDRLSMSRQPGDVSPVASLEYTDGDAKQAVEWLKPKLMHIHNRLAAVATAEKAEAAGASESAIRTYVDAQGPEVFTHRQFIETLIGAGVARSTAYRHFQKLLHTAAIANAEEPNTYRLDKGTVERIMSMPVPVAQPAVRLVAAKRKSTEPTVKFKSAPVPATTATTAPTAAPAPTPQKPLGPMKTVLLPVAKKAEDEDGDEGADDSGFSGIAAQFKPWE